MSIEQQYNNNKPNSGKVLIGLILLLVGGALLLRQITFFIIPDWLFSWPMWVIAFGLYLGAKHNFKVGGWLIFLVIGGLNLLDEAFPRVDFDKITWPVIIISIGMWFILRRNHKSAKYDNRWHNAFSKANPTNPFDPNGNPVEPSAANDYGAPHGAHYGDDYLDTLSIFSGTKKTILSKDFKGGEVVNVFGGTELNFAMADINGRVVIDISQIFGGIKMIVPPHWQVVSDVGSVFAGVDDKRHLSGIQQSADKVLVLKGVSVFAGIDIRSF